MGSPISLEGSEGFTLAKYVLGETPAVQVWEVDMVEVLNGVIEMIKPQMDKLPCFKPLGELLNGGILVGCATRLTDIGLVDFPQGISERTKTMEIQTIEEADAGTTSIRKSVVLTEDGVVLLWSAVYDRPQNQRHGRFTGGRDELAKESRFEIFDEKKLRDALSQSFAWKVSWRGVMFKIIKRLYDEMWTCIEKREERLQSMKDAYRKLNRTICRIHQEG